MTSLFIVQCNDSVNITMTKCIRFNTSGSNLMTAMTVKESVRSQLREVGIDYQELSQLPFDVRISERDYLLFCIVWNSDEYPWREVDSKNGLQE
jgi:hypothetical protein